MLYSYNLGNYWIRSLKGSILTFNRWIYRYYLIDIFVIFNLYYISCSYVKPMNRMILGNIQYRGVNYGGPVSQQRSPPPPVKSLSICCPSPGMVVSSYEWIFSSRTIKTLYTINQSFKKNKKIKFMLQNIQLWMR